MDFSCLGEAHGMITDLLVDSTLPPNVIGTLRIVADMLSPLLQQGLHRQTFSNPLITVFEKTQVQEDQKQVMNQPDLKDDTPLSLKQVSYYVFFTRFITSFFLIFFGIYSMYVKRFSSQASGIFIY